LYFYVLYQLHICAVMIFYRR